ncbi:LysR family transcriptional regulator [Salinicola sp. DM10]|uniref:LysR family transcriptional regulator n=1 Tax=Salinicola sp. DM10 TaxID=2815721 RepID=UPI001A903578|nr:LysR family transcriptional regulator [Salinicola sp. DM10]MCE3026952.1 LysR family transcriptional regulator [Salinicola sp. DM10]
MYDLDSLTTFADVMHSGSLTVSARRLGVAKSTLSRRIAHLEAQLGQPLLRRQANRLLPTEAGSLFLGYAREMLQIAECSQRTLDDLRAEISGEVVIEVHSALARGWMARQAEHFLAQHPQAQLVLRTLQAPPLASDANAIYVWLGEIDECGLRQERLGWLTYGIYASPDYLSRHGTPQHPRDLRRHDWIDRLGEAEKGMVLRHPEHGGYPLPASTSRLQVDQLVLHADAIVRSQGLGLMPHWMAQLRLRHHPGSLVPCLPDWQAPAQPITLLYPYGHQPRKIAALLEQLRHAVPEAWQIATPASPGLAICS